MMTTAEELDLRLRLKQARAALEMAGQSHMHPKARGGMEEADQRLDEALYMINVGRCRDLVG